MNTVVLLVRILHDDADRCSGHPAAVTFLLFETFVLKLR